MVASVQRALGVLGLLALVGFGLYARERFVRRSPLRFVYLTGQLDDQRYRELASRAGWARGKVTLGDGGFLNGLVRKPLAANARWVLYYSGNDATMLAHGQKFLSQLAGERDWGLAVFAYRGFDSSSGVPEIEQLGADASAIYDEVAAMAGTSGLHVVGFSIGGHLAVRAVAAAKLAGHPPRSLTLLAGVSDIVMLRRSVWQKFALGDVFRTSPFLKDVPAPVLVLQGSADEALGGPGQGREMAAILGARCSYQELEQVGHEALLAHAGALASVRAFIEQH